MSSPSDNDVVLNYILLDPREKHDAAYPLQLSRSDVEKRAFDVRKLIATEIENEFGLEINIKYLRLWKPKDVRRSTTPFNPINRLALLEKLWLLSFAHSLADSLDDSLEDSSCVHLVVTVHPDWTGTLPTIEPSPKESETTITDVPVIFTGVWTINPRRDWDIAPLTDDERHSVDIQTDAAITGTGHPLGTSMIDFGAESSFTSMTHADNIGPTSFRLHLDSWAQSHLFHWDVTWLRHSSRHRLLQSGSIDAKHAGGGNQSALAHRVDFGQYYDAPPKVFVALSGLKVGADEYWDLQAYCTGVDSRGFTLNIARSKGEESLCNSQVHWLAFPEYGVPGLQMCSGDVSVVGLEGDGRVVFEQPFEEEPMIFIAITQFRIKRNTTARLWVNTKSITREGFDWSVGTLGNTVLERSGFSFLAIEHRRLS